jgi:hypothetical protein
MQAVLSENTTQGSLRASQETARHCTADRTADRTADVLVGNHSCQNPHWLPTKTSAIRISSQARRPRAATLERGMTKWQ